MEIPTGWGILICIVIFLILVMLFRGVRGRQECHLHGGRRQSGEAAPPVVAYNEKKETKETPDSAEDCTPAAAIKQYAAAPNAHNNATARMGAGASVNSHKIAVYSHNCRPGNPQALQFQAEEPLPLLTLSLHKEKALPVRVQPVRVNWGQRQDVHGNGHIIIGICSSRLIHGSL